MANACDCDGCKPSEEVRGRVRGRGREGKGASQSEGGLATE